jgi:ferredoxin-NADP reductase
MATHAVLVGAQASKLMRREEVAERTMAFHFEKPSGFNFKAGQFADVTLTDPPETDAEGNTRTFSIASPPFENHLVFTTRMRDTAFKRSLRRLPLATEVKIGSAAGSFTLHKNPAKAAVLLAGGIGITPFLSILRQADQGPASAKVVPVLFQSTARRRRFPGHSADLGDDKSPLPLDLHHDRNVEIQERMERRDGSARQGDTVPAFGHSAGTYLLHCRASHHGGGNPADAGERRRRRGRYSGSRVCRLLRRQHGERPRLTLA